MLETMLRLKKVKNLDNRLDTMVDNAYYICRPPEKSARSLRKERSELDEYVRHLLFTQLSRHTLEVVKKQLRKLPWEQCEAYVIKSILKVHKCKYNQVGTPCWLP